jgi:signal transduction histidine kinase
MEAVFPHTTAPLRHKQIAALIESERSRIAGDLHDELGTLISLTSLDLETVLNEVAFLSPHAGSKLRDARNNIDRLALIIRNAIWQLSPLFVENNDLDGALREFFACEFYEFDSVFIFCSEQQVFTITVSHDESDV